MPELDLTKLPHQPEPELDLSAMPHQPELELNLAAMPHKPKPRTFGDAMKQAWIEGEEGIQLDILSFEAAMGQRDWKEVQGLRKKFQKAMAQERKRPTSWSRRIMTGTARMLPGMLRGYREGAAPALAAGAGAFVVGQIPPLTLVPDELVTVPAAMGIGAVYGAIKFWHDQGMGQAYAEMRDKDISHEVSSVVANVMAWPYALIEFTQVSRLIPWKRKAVKAVVTKAARPIRRWAVRMAARFGANWVSEVGEEVVQEVTMVTARRIGTAVENRLREKDIAQEPLVQEGLRLWETAKEAGGPMAVLLGPTTLAGGVRGFREAQAAGIMPEEAPVTPEVAVEPAVEAPVPPVTPEVAPGEVLPVEPVPTPITPPVVEPAPAVATRVAPAEAVDDLYEFDIKQGQTPFKGTEPFSMAKDVATAKAIPAELTEREAETLWTPEELSELSDSLLERAILTEVQRMQRLGKARPVGPFDSIYRLNAGQVYREARNRGLVEENETLETYMKMAKPAPAVEAPVTPAEVGRLPLREPGKKIFARGKGRNLRVYLDEVNAPSMQERIGVEKSVWKRGPLEKTKSTFGGWRYLYRDEGGTIIGAVQGVSKKGEHVLSNIFVLPANRKQGIGTELVDAAKKDMPNLVLGGSFTLQGAEFFKVPVTPAEVSLPAEEAVLAGKIPAKIKEPKIIDILKEEVAKLKPPKPKPVMVTKEAAIRSAIAGYKKGIKEGKRALTLRRALLQGVREAYGLSEAQFKKVVKRHIGVMSDKEFIEYVTQVKREAEKAAERNRAMEQLQAQILEKELNVENLRKAMKLPKMAEMKTSDIKALDEAIKPFQKGDVFLGPRKLQTIDRTELKGIKTWREAREILAKKLKVPLHEVEDFKVSEFERFKGDVALAKTDPFYRMMVEETAALMLTREQEYLEIEQKTLEIAKKFKPKGLIARLIPQQKIVRRYMEAPANKKADIAVQMSNAEMELAQYLTEQFEEAREYLIKVEAMNLGRENYFSHVRRGILEAVKEDGVIQAAKEVFTKYIAEEQTFNILDRETGEILALDKFFKFAMHRVEGPKALIPTENVVRAFLTYMKTFKKKQALDEIVPLIDIYAHALTPKGVTKTGVLLHGNLVRFVKEWLNTKKGRHITLIAKQGGKIDRAIRGGVMLTTIRDLAGNLPVGIATQIGEIVSTYQLLGKRKYIRGMYRKRTKQGKAIIEKNRAFIGKNPWKELAEPAKSIGDKLSEGIFIMFSDANVRNNETFLLGAISTAEFESGEISPIRLAALRTELGRYRMIPGAKSVLAATPEGRQWMQYKTWAAPHLRTTLENLANLTTRLRNPKITKQDRIRAGLELYRQVELVAFVLAIRAFLKGDDRDEGFVGKLISKAYREAMTTLQALSPKIWLSAGRLASFAEELGSNLYLLMMLERYKTPPKKLKGLEKLKRQFKPVVISQFQVKKKKKEEKKLSQELLEL